MLSSKFIRVISILGILLLLTLQYVWLKNAYEMVERDVMEKSKGCLKEAVEEELWERLDKTNVKIAVVKNDHHIPKNKVVDEGTVHQSSDINVSLQNLTTQIGFPCIIGKIDTILQKKLFDCFGSAQKYTLRIINDSVRSKVTLRIVNSGKAEKFITGIDSLYQKDSCKVDDLICGNTIFIKLNEKQSVELVLTSPITTVINKARYIFAISILLVILIFIIMLYQLKSMMKEKEFVTFIKDYTKALAHEMRTPVNGIHMLTSRLITAKKELDLDTEFKYHKECLNLCNRLILTVDNILLVARAEHAAIIVNKTELDMRIFIEGIVEKYRFDGLQRKEIKISTHYEPSECFACIDSDLMENTINNLIENAIKYSNASVEIDIACTIEKNNLQINIKDNGFGISQQDQKNIFQLFKRGEKVNSKQISGFGIGLHYVEKVVTAHRGSIKVISEEGIGSEFIISIPNKG